jgi:hypothetical protein
MPVAVGVPREDPVRRQQVQDPVEAVRVGAARRRQLFDAYGFLAQLVGDSELGDDLKAPRRDDVVHESPDDLVRLCGWTGCGHRSPPRRWLTP